ncbi:hypothetical protein [Streptomyces macrosporus]
MEHEVYVPFTVGAVRTALADPERVARCVPGLRPDAAEAVAGDGVSLRGRLRVRIGGSSITYRGGLRLTHGLTRAAHETSGTDGSDGPAGSDGGSGDERYTVDGEGTEARGAGAVELTLTVVPRPTDDGEGTTLACTAELRGTGRITEFEEKQREAAGRRLLDRFGGELAASLAADPVAPVDASGTVAASGGIGEPDDNEPVIPGIPAPETPDAADARERDAARAENTGEEDTGEAGEPEAPEAPREAPVEGIFEVEIPPSSLDPTSDDAFADDLADEGFGDDLDGIDDLDDLGGEVSPVTAEAAHARRTMIGRSAEEVDHAPPRGRYAPVPPPETTSPALTALRWAAPAAALVVASAVVVGRVLRRRR